MSRNPSSSAVASDMEMVIAALESGQTRTAWSFFKSKGVKKTESKIKGLKVLIKSTRKLVGELRSGEDFADLARNPEYVKALSGAAQYVNGDSEIIEAYSNVENESDVRDLMMELDGLYEEDDDSELDDRRAMVSALDAFVKKAEERVKKLQDRLKDQTAEAKKGKSLEGKEPVRGPKPAAPKKPGPEMFQKLRDRSKSKVAP